MPSPEDMISAPPAPGVAAAVPIKSPRVVMRNGRIEQEDDDARIDYEMLSPTHQFTGTSSAIPLASTIKGARFFIGSKYATQALPLVNPEAPLVDNLDDDSGEGFSTVMGRKLGQKRSPFAGVVTGIHENYISIKKDGGGTERIDLKRFFPSNKKTYTSEIPTVEVGARINPGDVVARNNFTDKDGRMALGRNLAVAFMPAPGGATFEDAIVVSQSAANKMTSPHMYGYDVEHKGGVGSSKQKFLSLFPNKYTNEQLAKFGDDGMLKPGAVVERGDPVLLSFAPRSLSSKDAALGNISKLLRNSFEDLSQTWDHDTPGRVAHAVSHRNGLSLKITTNMPLQEGDKMCMSPDHEVLTPSGWVPIGDMKAGDGVYSLDISTNLIEEEMVGAVHSYHLQNEDMYSLETSQVSMCVTPNHKLPVKTRNGACSMEYGFMEAKDLFGKRYRLKRDGVVVRPDVDSVVIDPVPVRLGGRGRGKGIGSSKGFVFSGDFYAWLVGAYVSEGSLRKDLSKGDFGIHIAQTKPSGVREMKRRLDAEGVKYIHNKSSRGFIILGVSLYEHFKQFGSRSWRKTIPQDILAKMSGRQLRIMIDGLVWGDGSVRKNGSRMYFTSSPLLADDFQHLCFLAGVSATVRHKKLGEDFNPNGGVIDGRRIVARRDRYIIGISERKNSPQVNHGHAKKQKGQSEKWIKYTGPVFCLTVPKNHTFFVRRGGKVHWTGNSAFQGAKGVVSRIVPDDQMVRSKNGEPLDILINPAALIGRVNPGMVFEALLGKIAHRHNKRYVLPSFTEESVRDFVEDELKAHGESDTEDLEDPMTGKIIPKVMTGRQLFLKLEHTSESKIGGRGEGGVDCFDDQTDVLTERGWVNWSQVRDDDLFFTIDGNKPVYLRAERVVRQRYNGEMLGFRNRFLDFLVTPNHRHFVKFQKPSSKFRFESADRLFDREFYVRQFGFDHSEGDNPDVVVISPPMWTRKTRARKDIPELQIPFGLYAEFSGWWISEGSVVFNEDRNEFRVFIWQNQKINPDEFAEIEGLLVRMGLKFSHHKRSRDGILIGFRIDHAGLAQHLIREFGAKCQNKRISRRLMRSSIENRRILLDKLIKGDGCEKLQTACAGRNLDNEVISYATTSRGLADDVQELAVSVGWGGIIRERPAFVNNQGYQCKKFYVVGICKRRVTAMAYRQAGFRSRHFKIQYSGMVYCATIPQTGLLYVRRNGLPFLSGNSNDQPSKGGDEGAKRFGGLQQLAILSHGANEVIRDAHLYRGSSNPDMWRKVKLGENMPAPKSPFIYTKYINSLKAAGINVKEDNSGRMRLFAMTDDDVDSLTKNELQNAETISYKDGSPIKGGLMDFALHGGPEGRGWSKITLDEPMPNPIMEDSLRKILGITEKQMRGIIGGTETLGGKTGPGAIKEALDNIDLDRLAEVDRDTIRNGRKTKRDDAVRRLHFITGLQKSGLKPSDLMITKVPVLPPTYRPVSAIGKLMLTADANYLYRDLMTARQALRQNRTELPDHDLSDERLAIYDSIKAIQGLGDPINPETAAKGVKGFIRQIAGVGGPKTGLFVSKVLGHPVNAVGRSVIVPNSDLNMDEVGIPFDMAWPMFEAKVIRSMVKGGMPATEADRHFEKRDGVAMSHLQKVVDSNHVMYSRDPALHRFSIMGAKPRLVPGNNIQLSPLVVKPFGADFDGDQMNIHLPISDEAQKEVRELMLPSKNLFSLRHKKVHYLPSQEFVYGTALATTPNKKLPLMQFPTAEAAIEAYRQKLIPVDQPIEILQR